MNGLKQLVQLRKNLLRLQMEYAVHLITHEQNNFTEAINKTEARFFCVGLKETEENSKAWAELFEKAQSCFDFYGPAEFVDASWRDVWSHAVKSKAPFDLEYEKNIVAGSFAGFTYEYHYEYFTESPPHLLTLHFRNAFVPDSPFRHLEELLAGLKIIFVVVSQDRPDISRFQCASWLNNIPFFINLFPESWLKDSKEVPVEGNSGWWGQFITREGDFNFNRAESFRRTWKFEYVNRMCTCDIRTMCNYLSID